MKTFVLIFHFVLPTGAVHDGYSPNPFPTEKACMEAGEKLIKGRELNASYECKEQANGR